MDIRLHGARRLAPVRVRRVPGSDGWALLRAGRSRHMQRKAPVLRPAEGPLGLFEAPAARPGQAGSGDCRARARTRARMEMAMTTHRRPSAGLRGFARP